MDITSLFPYADSELLNRSALIITAEEDIAGYVGLATSGDDLYYPLLSEENIGQELVVPHVAVNDDWWTGFTFFNPFSEDATLTVLPYDADGRLMEDIVVDKVIEANRKGVFTVVGLLGDQASLVSFIKFDVSSGPGIGGIYAYGNTSCSMLSGAVMQ